METIIISRSKLKIMLTPPDMQKYAIAAEPPDFTDDATRRALRRIAQVNRLRRRLRAYARREHPNGHQHDFHADSKPVSGRVILITVS